MALINASIPNLINGVSQQPPSLRLKTQCELQENGISSVVSGLSKRPCTEHIASLGALANSDNAFIHTIRRDQNEFYTLIITSDGTNCTFRIYDKNGTAKSVNSSTSGFLASSFSYFNGITNPAQQIVATTVADYTFLLNKNKTVAKLSTKSPVTPKQALLYVKQADYSTKYTVTIKQGSNTYVREITTMASTQDTTALVHQAEQSVQTDRLALSLAHNNTPDSIYTANTTGFSTIPNMTLTEYGSVIHVQSTNNSDFTIEVDDSRGNNHIFAFKDKVADFKRGEKDILFRELALFKLLANSKKQEKIKKICKKFNPVILDKSKKSFVIQVTALRAEIDKLAIDLKRLGLISTSRTGAVAMTKGPKVFN